MSDYAIEMMHITKMFPGVVANDDVVLQVRKGEVHALLGENGAGKSTLVSVLFGLYEPEEGEIYINGDLKKIKNPGTANRLGIGMVHQHFMLIDNFTVLENILLGVETVKNGKIDMKEARKKVLVISEKYNLNVNLDALVSDISVGMQQKVEILKMLYRENNILIFDEPTAVLTPQEIEELMLIMKKLSKEGKSLIFISHKLNEIKLIADRCTVLRKGKCIGTVDVKNVSVEKMSEMMVGRKVDFDFYKDNFKPGEKILEINNLNLISDENKNKKILNNINLNIRRGEILCVAGIEGNGQTELVESITGLRDIDAGEITVLGKNLTNESIRFRNTHGISYIPEDRHKFGLILDFTLEENLILKKYFTKEFQKNYFLKFPIIHKYAKKLIEEFDIRSGEGEKSIVRSMSGGNQQKAIIAREVDLGQDLIVAVQPTRGLDVGAIEYVHKQLLDEREKGKAVLLISYELDEVMNISDRIVVLYEGEITAELYPRETNIKEIGLYMSGSKRSEVKNDK